MTPQDKLAKVLLQKHGALLNNFEKRADGWWVDLKNQIKDEPLPEYKRVSVAFGKDQRAVLSCVIADNEELQVLGLQKHAGLQDDEGMIFPYPEPRRVSFHMGEVPFNIDIMFVGDDGRITKKVENIEPGTRGNWGMPNTAVVIEAAGGFCRKHKIETGCEVYELMEREAQNQNKYPIKLGEKVITLIEISEYLEPPAIPIGTIGTVVALGGEWYDDVAGVGFCHVDFGERQGIGVHYPTEVDRFAAQAQCMCGVDSVSGGKHSPYCPKYKTAQHSRILELAYDSQFTGEVIYLKEEAGMFWCECPLVSTPMHQDADAAKIDMQLLMEHQYGLAELPQLQWQPYQQRLAMVSLDSWDEISGEWQSLDIDIDPNMQAEALIDYLDQFMGIDPPTRESEYFKIVMDGPQADGSRRIDFRWGQDHEGIIIVRSKQQCQCGVDAVGGGMHSSYCPKYKKIAQKFMPAFYDKQQDRIINSPGFHNPDVLEDPDWAYYYPGRYTDGFVDDQGKFYTRQEMENQHQLNTSEELYKVEDYLSNPAHKMTLEERQQQYPFTSLPDHKAQETFPRYPRKDLNPKMLAPVNPTLDRFRDRDLVDQQVQNQPMGPQHQETLGVDPITYHDDEEVAPTRPGY